MHSNTLLASNNRFIVSVVDDRVATRRTDESLTLLKPDYLGHKGNVTHIAIHQADHCSGSQDDWGRVVASSDVTNRVKVWLCDGDEEELMFARNMAEYVGYDEITALAWTGDSKVAIGVSYVLRLIQGMSLELLSSSARGTLLLGITDLFKRGSRLLRLRTPIPIFTP
jgi:hypothetical protein